MIGIIAKKIGMTSVYHEGCLVPCTIVETKPCIVTQIKTKAKDGYEAVQLAYDDKKEKNTTRPLQGHFKVAQTTPKRKLREFRDFPLDQAEVKITLGSHITAEATFEEEEYIDVEGISKGKGFCGVMKRHGFSGVGERTHGQHNRERAPGSIGASSCPSRVFKGMRMAGRMGNSRVKVKNLKILKIMPKEGVVVLKGTIPGPRRSYVVLQK